MGQCLPAQTSELKFHPLLGNLQSLISKGQHYMDLKILISSQQQYMNWSKNINKLKYNNQINKIIYLPIRQHFNNSQGFCQTNHEITLRFKSYHQTLVDNMSNNIGFNRHYQQGEIWHLIYTLVKYAKYFNRVFNLTYHHVVIDCEGKLKVIPQIILPSFLNSYQNDFQVNQKYSNRINLIGIIGLIALSLADLIYPTTFYDQYKKKWKQIPEQRRVKYLSNCKQRYSQQLVNTIKQMIQPNNFQKLTLQQWLCKLEVIQPLEIPKKRFFGDSRQETTRDNYDLASIKNSNLFMSQGTNRLWQSQVRFQQSKNDQKHTHQMEYPSIL